MNSTKKIFIGLLLLTFNFFTTETIEAQEPMLGEVRVFGGSFIPRGWAACDGSILPISSNQALFSLIGCTYGGDCRSTFALPDLRGRVAVGYGSGKGSQPGTNLQPIDEGQKSGIDLQVLTLSQLPRHSHIAINTEETSSFTLLSTENATNETPKTGNIPAIANYKDGLIDKKLKAFGPPSKTVNGQNLSTPTNLSIHSNGNSAAFENRQPFLGVQYIIATSGYYPSRS